MKNKFNVFKLLAATVICLLVFWIGTVVGHKNVVTYSVNGIPTSFNKAWPTYGLPLMEDQSILMLLQNGHATDAIPLLEAYLDSAVFDAECRRPLLKLEGLNDIDKALTKVAHYRLLHPRQLTNSTNNVDQFWIATQKNINTFLAQFDTTNSVKP